MVGAPRRAEPRWTFVDGRRSDSWATGHGAFAELAEYDDGVFPYDRERLRVRWTEADESARLREEHSSALWPSRRASALPACSNTPSARSTDSVTDLSSDAGEAAAVLRRLLAAVEAGELYADGPVGSGVVRQMRGAVVALEAVAGDEERPQPEQAV